MATFDYANKVIILDSPATSPVQNALDIYSEWKQDVQVSDNLKWLPAFGESVGGNQTTATQKISGYVFVRNDLGWRVRPAEEDGETIIEGDLFPFDPLTALYLPTVGDYTAIVRLQVSSKALVEETDASGLNPTESTILTEIYQRFGLDSNAKVTYTDNQISVGGIILTITNPDVNTTEVQRSP